MSDLQLKHNLKLTTAEVPRVISHPAYFVYFLIKARNQGIEIVEKSLCVVLIGWR